MLKKIVLALKIIGRVHRVNDSIISSRWVIIYIVNIGAG